MLDMLKVPPEHDGGMKVYLIQTLPLIFISTQKQGLVVVAALTQFVAE